MDVDKLIINISYDARKPSPKSLNHARFFLRTLFFIYMPGQGRRHQVLFGGTDSWAPKPTHPQNCVSPRISTTLFRKCWKIENLQMHEEKDTEML